MYHFTGWDYTTSVTTKDCIFSFITKAAQLAWYVITKYMIWTMIHQKEKICFGGSDRYCFDMRRSVVTPLGAIARHSLWREMTPGLSLTPVKLLDQLHVYIFPTFSMLLHWLWKPKVAQGDKYTPPPPHSPPFEIVLMCVCVSALQCTLDHLAL